MGRSIAPTSSPVEAAGDAAARLSVRRALDLVRLGPLLERGSGDPRVIVGVLDGPVALDQADLSGASRMLPGNLAGRCAQKDSIACIHGTFVASVLGARRGSPAPAICPGCTLLVRPIFGETARSGEVMPSTTPGQLADALVEAIHAGGRVINLSAALVQPSSRGERALEQALDFAAHRDVLIVAAAGNQGLIGSSPITRHPWVIPVAACQLDGRPIAQSNLGGSIGRRGLQAPGDHIAGLGPDGRPVFFSGTSVAAPFVTGTIALLWSLFPSATGPAIRSAVTSGQSRRAAIVPPLLDATAAFQFLAGRTGAEKGR